MNHRILAGMLSLGVLLLTASATLFLGTKSKVACTYFDCASSYYYVDVVSPLTQQIWPLAVLFAALLFVRRDVFYKWLTLFLPLSVIALVLVINSKTALGGWFPHIYPNRQEMTHISVLFLVGISVVFVGYQYFLLFFKGRQSSTHPNAL